MWVNGAFLTNYALDHPGVDGLSIADEILGKTDYDLSPALGLGHRTCDRVW